MKHGDDARRVWAEAFAAGLKPRSLMTGSEWADEYRYVAPGTTSRPGPWRTDMVPYLKEPLDVATDRTTEELCLMWSSQVGKALCVETPIPTPDGWTTMGALRVGDRVYDENGLPCMVVAATEVMRDRPCFEVEFSDGTVIRADAEHLWLVDSHRALSYVGKYKKGVFRGVLATKDMLKDFRVASGTRRKHRDNYSIPVAGALIAPDAKLPIRPYSLGVWLGDGHTASNRFFGHKDDLELADYVREDGYNVVVELGKGGEENHYTAVIDPAAYGDVCKRGHDMRETGRTKQGYCRMCSRQYALVHKWKDTSRMDPIIGRKSFGQCLIDEGLTKGKRIPREYFRASYDQRMELFRGLMDTDGTISGRGRCSITLSSEALSRDVLELARTLGLKPSFRERTVVCTNAKGRPESTAWVVDFMAYDDQPVFKLRRKLARMKSKGGPNRSSETFARRITDIRPIESIPVRCIQVSSESRLFLAGEELVPTHNSELLLNIMGYYVDQEPAPQLLLMPTVEAVEAFSKERIDPTFRHSPGLRGKLETPKEGRTNSRKSSDTIRMKHFPGGYIAMVGANSPTGLSSRPIRIVLGDEVDRMPMDTGEGSPLRLAKQRATNFHNKKLLWVSTPTKRGESNIELMWERSDKRFFNIPCRDCGTLSAWKWDQIRWDKDAQNNVIYESVRHVCPACDATIRGNGMPDVQLLREGAWIATDTSPGRIAGFHLSSLYSPWVTLSELVQEFVDAARARNRNGMQEFVNLKLGELFEEAHDTLSQEGLHKRREYYDAEVPEDVLILTAGVDIQERYIAAEIVGWGKGRESWGIEYRIIPGDPTQPEVWDQLDEFLLKTRYTPAGVGLSVVCTCVDSGDQTTDVYRYTKPRESRRVYAIKGSGTVGRPFISKPTNNNRVGALLWTIGVNDGKSSLLTRLAVEDEGPGYCHFPRKGEAGYDGEYFKGLLSERWSRTIVNGKVQAGWRKIHERNEPLDCRVYATAAIEILNPDFDRLAQEERRGDVYVQSGSRQRRRGVISRGVT